MTYINLDSALDEKQVFPSNKENSYAAKQRTSEDLFFQIVSSIMFFLLFGMIVFLSGSLIWFAV